MTSLNNFSARLKLRHNGFYRIFVISLARTVVLGQY